MAASQEGISSMELVNLLLLSEGYITLLVFPEMKVSAKKKKSK
jgi:hypothetical protein